MPKSERTLIPLSLKMDEEDHQLLAETAAAEKLPKSEILRRALRIYAANLRRLPNGGATLQDIEHSESAATG